MKPLLGVLLLAWATSPPAHAARAPSPGLPALCQQADLVVLGELTGSDSLWGTHALRPIETRWDLWVDQTLRGAAPAAPIEIVTAGGTVGAVTLDISEQPELHLDRPYVLLLSRLPDGRFAITGGPDGVVAVARTQGPDGEPVVQVPELPEACHVD